MLAKVNSAEPLLLGYSASANMHGGIFVEGKLACPSNLLGLLLLMEQILTVKAIWL